MTGKDHGNESVSNFMEKGQYLDRFRDTAHVTMQCVPEARCILSPQTKLQHRRVDLLVSLRG